jgi:hypothetical protein
MKFAWCNNIVDLAAWNLGQHEEVNIVEYSEMLEEDEQAYDFAKDSDNFVMDDSDQIYHTAIQ